MTHLGDLNQQLQQKLEQDRKQIQELHDSELAKLKQNLDIECQNVLNTFNNATEVIKQKTQNQLKWYLALPAITTISLLGTFFISNWGMMQYLSQQANKIASQQAQIRKQQKTLEHLTNKTWGIELYSNNQGKFIILPPTTDYPTDWKCNNQPCLKLTQ
jgi:hypothetical protein